MIQNIKVDIVYFMTATDFEFEFNLGSCCHMRLLTDKVKDRKSFVNSLARAVSRSQIIISCGPLFGEEGLISTAATAINHGLETVDNKAYGLASNEKIEIIEGSVPLVTPEGYFGGCIIESGSQTIIVLTENRTIRKSIMKNLVHPYIEEVSIIQSAEKAPSGSIADMVRPAVTEINEPPAEDGNKQPQQDEPVVEDTLNDTSAADDGDADEYTKTADDDGHNIAFDFSDGETKISDEADFSADGDDSVLEEIDPKNGDNTEDIFDYDEKVRPRRSGKGINISIIIIAAVLLLAILALCYFLIFLPIQNGLTTAEYFKRIFGVTSSVGSV